MKKIIILIIFIVVFLIPQKVYADEISDYIKDNVDHLDVSDFESYLNEVNIEINIKEEILKVINGEYGGNIIDFLNLILKYIGAAISDYIPMIISIIIISLIESLINSFSANFLRNEIKEIVYLVSYAAVLLVIIYKIYEIISKSSKTINNIILIMEHVFPILLTLVTLIGGSVSISVYKPLMIVLTSVISMVINSIIMPLFSGTILLSIISRISKNIKLDKMISFVKSISHWLISGIFTIFVTFLSFQGLTSGVIDTVSIKSAKFALESYVPILGGYLSDGYDLILASIVLIKNSFGVISIVLIMGILIIPIINIIVFSLSLKLTSAIVEPICDKRIGDMLFDISKNMMLLIGVLISIFAMFLILVMMIILSLNLGAV